MTPLRKPISILIVEDHVIVMEGLKMMLEGHPLFRVVGEADDGLQVMQACHRHEPELVLLDLGLPGMDGMDVIVQLKQRWPELMIVVMTGNNQEYKASHAFAAGAQGYVLKHSSQSILLHALQRVAAGKRFLDPALNRELVMSALDEHDGGRSLTSRERQVLKLITEGYRNREIGERLTISQKTVETHRLNLMRKLDAHNAAELVNLAQRLGLF
jgi:two-component system secretion response regulator SsrB